MIEFKSVNLERENSLNDRWAGISFVLPDGLECCWQFHPLDTPTDVLLGNGRDLAIQTIKLGQESRLSADKDDIAKVARIVQSEYPHLNINFGKTTFFEQELKNTNELQIPDWNDISSEYSLIHAFRPDTTEALVIKSFMEGSFDNANTQSIDISLRNAQNNVYLIKNNDLYLGMFVLIYIPKLGEIQLHSVTGKGASHLIGGQKPKLPILLSGVFEAVQRDLNPNMGTSETSAAFPSVYKTLTFSSSGAAPLYQKLGFQESKRGGLSIKKP